MTAIDEGQYAAWAARLSGDQPPPGSAGAPDWLTANVIRLDGPQGMSQLSNFGRMEATDENRFEAALLRFPIGATMLYSTMQTAHVVTYGRGARLSEDIVIVGFQAQGSQRLRAERGAQLMDVGRMGFMSSLGASSAEHLGVTETTGVVVPADLLSGARHALERGADLFPDTPLTRAAGVTFRQMLSEWLRAPEQGAEAFAGAETALISLVRALFAQFPAGREGMPAGLLVIAAQRVVERRHRDAAFTLDQLADALHVSRRQLFRVFATSERSAATMLLQRRLETAGEELLRTPDEDLTVIAQRSGFADAAALRAQFGRHIGLSPRAFRLASLTRQERLAEAMLLSDEQSGPSSPVGASET